MRQREEEEEEEEEEEHWEDCFEGRGASIERERRDVAAEPCGS